MQNKVLIYGSMSFAGMGPYVSEIINTFTFDDNITYMLFDIEDQFFAKNIKSELKPLCKFVNYHHGIISKADFLLGIYKRKNRKILIDYCLQHNITAVHFINGCTDNTLINKLHKNNIKTLITVHDLHPHESDKELYKRWKYHTLAKQERKCLYSCPNLVTNSRIQYNELKHLFPEKNIFFHEFPSLVSKNIREGNDIPPEIQSIKKKYILFFGRIEKYKGIDILYKSFCDSKELQKEYTLVIAGKGRFLLKQNEYNPNVMFINRYIKDTEVGYLFKKASAVVYPYISATQSGVLSLSCFFNTPTLTSDIPYFKSIIDSSEIAITFNKNDTNDLTKQLLKILNSSTEKMKEKQQQFYNFFYSANSIRETLTEIYKNLIL
ncbi:MAG: glycosyltransferase [Phocaeicola sp.]|jgi:glycosyltransferase involved in cell wall biosynthesis|uniref:glycosyltransferase family 4 protein n=1 Tax=Phocaeicola sp. TaxID=2773926 RepID=UPI00300ED090